MTRRRARTLQLLTLRATPQEVLDQLKREGFAEVSLRTYQRDYEALQGEAATWLDGFAKNGLVEEYRHAILSMQERVRRLIIIESSAATKQHEKIAANEAIVEIETLVIELLIEGPTVWALKRKAQREGQAQIDKASQATGGHERTSAAAT